jgi:Zn-dependent membrane protease YugP
MFLDPMYFLFLAPGLILAMWAQAKVKSAYEEARQHRAKNGMTGAECAERILESNGIHDVTIEQTPSLLGDHYDPRSRVLRLSPDVYEGQSLASLGIAAHEVGHALQHANHYAPLKLRSGLIPIAAFGSQLAYLFIFLGLIISAFRPLAFVGLAIFAVAFLCSLVTLPVEFDASRRARAILTSQGIVTHEEDEMVGKVLNAAALTYVAAAITALMTFLYYATVILGRRNN